jgi:hypothetical protein
MTNRQENKLAMYLATLSVMNQNFNTWTTVPAITAAVNTLDQKINDIRTASAAQDLQLTGIATDKRQLRARLVELGYQLSSIISAFAQDTADNELKDKVDYSFSELNKISDSLIAQRCTNFHDLGTTWLADLTSYGVTQQQLDDLKQAIDDYVAKAPAPRTAASNKVAVTRSIKELFEETDQLLKSSLDKLVITYKTSTPSFYNAYSVARSIIDLGKSSHFVDIQMRPATSQRVERVVIGSVFTNTGQTALIVIGDKPENEDGVEVMPGDNILLNLTNPVIRVNNPHSSLPGAFRVRVTSEVPITTVSRPEKIIVRIPPNQTLRVDHIVRGSQVENMGPATVTICDCSEPDCGITDDDQPCGYEQTIEAANLGTLDTNKNFVHISNKDAIKTAKVKITVFQPIANAGPATPL